MAQRSSIEQLPKEVRHWLERALTENGFSGYKQLENLLKEKGYQISKSAIHRYGQKLEKRFQAIKNSTEAARLIAEGAEDEGDHRSEALMAMIQSSLFDALIDLEDADQLEPDEKLKLLSFTGKNIAALTQASTKLKAYQSEVKQRAELAAKEVEKVVKKGGLSDDVADEIRRKILGIATE
ncbi:DUF3486 family protein [Pasteurella skyensis]|uniref:DUF3486 family protein n=1 Tax=Phocoenobacter skyensis TaxID=97481 RepID=A0AAJ6N9F7_9PAST|nr:DUF3486 family protein [Pasteurella skyensis]MDP8162817.1 DUF3486 family protein [Pasteurella skyensis]MDP8172596.1 DUF3486 family protein [Pasteurella skyensis]MDP8179096.1 DUF3486 family protein [Pasteurella skyensis]MDP8183219.1 DUF3486 family protein [Pasteurella skyensis]MDP8189270.1 DUF3486 family protein [Pasteurella skyensis]